MGTALRAFARLRARARGARRRAPPPRCGPLEIGRAPPGGRSKKGSLPAGAPEKRRAPPGALEKRARPLWGRARPLWGRSKPGAPPSPPWRPLKKGRAPERGALERERAPAARALEEGRPTPPAGRSKKSAPRPGGARKRAPAAGRSKKSPPQRGGGPFWGSSLRSAASAQRKADSTLKSSQAVPHPSTYWALRRLTLEVGRDPVHLTRYGRQRTKWPQSCTAP